MTSFADVAVGGVVAVAALAGQVTAHLAEGRRATAAHGREEAARAAEHTQRYAESQRATLHDLQEAVVELLDLFLALALTPPELSEISGESLRQYLLAARLKMLTQRVDDDSSRAEVSAAAAVLEEFLEAGGGFGGDIKVAIAAADRAQAALGAALRALL